MPLIVLLPRVCPMQVRKKNTLQRRCCSLQTEKMVLQKNNNTNNTGIYIFVYTAFGRMSSSVGEKNTPLAQNQDGDAQRTANLIE